MKAANASTRYTPRSETTSFQNTTIVRTVAMSASDTEQERLKSALWYHVGKLVDEACMDLNVNATPQFIGSLTELAWVQLDNIAKDLENFAKHANRSTVSTADVLLLARKNPDLHGLLQKVVDDEAAERAAKAAGKSRR
ncbi:hypothetical protein TWF506_002015 [Arthrobotrys conoides]|uniref:Centromere protein S n=1 Tax=Arthrobotrys conoides TaxID=74498 RepID=A0AAN8PAN0_9PEZI